MGRLMSIPLDRDRPLWETWLVEGLAGGRWALIFKVHHCLVDGIAGVDLLGVLLDTRPDPAATTPVPWTPRPEPGGAAKVLDAWAGLLGETGAAARRVSGALLHPAAAASATLGTARGLARFLGDLGATPARSIEGTIGPHRVWAHSAASLDDVRLIRTAFGGTINDVVLAAVSGGYRDLLLARGEDADHAVVRTAVPVSTRHDDGHGIPDNRVSTLLYDLPVGVDDPVARLTQVGREMRELKASHMAEAGAVVTTVADLVPPMVVGPASRLVTRVLHRLPQRAVNTITTNVPGPQFPLYCLGRRMLEYRPFVPIVHGIRVSTAILSYDGNLYFGITGDGATAPDVDVVACGTRTAVDRLVACARAHLDEQGHGSTDSGVGA
jgi:diacylglycerol O-acyltransferase